MGLYEINRGRLYESKKIKEMGMRNLITKFNPPHINKLIRIINEDIKKGKIEIEYYSMDEFNRIFEMFQTIHK